MGIENEKLKRSLTMQSFLPLFTLTFFKYLDCDMLKNFKRFVEMIFSGQLDILKKVISHPHTWMFLILVSSFIGMLIGLIAMWQFSYYHFSGCKDSGEKVEKIVEKKESGISFFMTFILPLMMDEVTSMNDFFVYIGVLYLTMKLMSKTNLYYQNPVLVLLGYKIIEFEFKNPESNDKNNEKWIGICKKGIDKEKVVLWKSIADNVCIIRNKN